MNSTISGSVRQNLIILMCNVLIYSGLFAQSSVCPIGVPMAPSKTNEQNSTSMVRDIMSTNSVKWDSLTNVKFSDNHKTRISLPSAKRSRAFVGSNLNFQVPVGATIDGIMITVEGRSTNRTNIDELQVHLLDSMGMPIGLNKANTAGPQNAWDNPLSGDDHMWMYGSPTDTWGIDWTPEMVNNTNFGYMFQLRNRNTSPVDVSVDQIVVTVFYSELLTACDDKCLTFYIDKLEAMGSYKWHVPVGFRMVSHYLNDQTIDLKIVDAKFGIHEICVDVYDQSGNFVETCCRDFLYQDCTSSVIDGQVWLDYNDNKMRDFNEGILPNVRLVLFNQNNQPVDTVFSNAAGKYRFTDLPAGKFYVQVPDVTNHAIIKKTGNDPDRDSDVTDANGPSTTDLIMTIIAKTVFNVDFGYTPLVNIGDYVWLDANFDGLQTSGEVGIAGVKVVLMNEAGLRIDSTTTNDEGKYIFQNKPANKYRLKFEDVGNSLLATFKNPTNTALNSDIDSLGRTLLYTIITAGTRDDIDAGYYKPASISGLAWDDKNGDGIRTDNELPLSNVAISLKGQSGNGQNIIRNTQTNDAGSYIFTKLPPGTYTLDWNLPTDYHWTALNQGSNDAMDNDVALDSLLGPLTVTSGDSLINNDGGAYRYGSIGDFVWEDINGNGLQDVNEPGIADAIITLWKNGVEVGSITSGDDGLYTLDSIVPGTYTVRIEIDGEYLPIMEDVGFDDAVDSDADVNGNVVGVAVMSGMAMNTIDAGFYRPSTMGDFVWEDMNANGIQDIGEPGLVNVNVVLSGLSNTGLPVSLTTITNTQGQYLLEGLAPGMYNINFTAAAQYNITAVDKGGDNTKDSDIDALGNVMNISVTSGSTNNDIDAGYYEYAQVGNFVWEDMNANGSQDADELGISNVALTLTGTDGAGNVVTLNMTTNADGAYAFTNIIPGSYQISAQIGQEYQQTKANSTTADKDSDFDNNVSPSFTLVSAENKDSIDAGYFRYAELGNFTWVDANGNGLQDINENGLSGVLVTLTGVNGFGDNITRMSITNTSGIYIFDNLIPGTYGINFGVSQDKLYTISNAGDDARDSDPIEGSVTNITLISNQKNETIDAGYLMPVEIGDFVWEDTNTNGIQDANEPGLQGLSVTLTGTDVLGMTVNEIVETNESGLYLFEKVYPGTYTIALSYTDPFIPTKFKMGTATLVDSDLNPDGTSFQLTINSVDDDLSIDFGLVKKGSIGDLVWEDLNCNGAREGDEPGIAGVKVNLTGQNLYNDVVNLATTTDDNGNYIFDNLTPGNYTINPEPPATYSLAPSTINTVNMQSGQNELSIDFPMFRKGSIGDFVWNDDNEDGIQQSTETGLAGVIVQLTSTNLATPVNTQTTTNAQGQYIFDDLKPATYKLTFVAPLNFASTVRNQGQDVTLDSDIGPTGMTNEIVIISNQDETNVDAGFFSLAKGSITGQAFEDMNANGQNEAGDPVLAGIPVTLIAENGTNIGTTVTDAQGIYSFIGLLGGNYKISIGNTPNLNLTDANTGVESTDSDVNVANRESDLFSLATNATVSNIDAGFFRYGSIGDFVWNDANEDGIQQPTETGINNVKVTINTTPTASTTTDASGKYTFDNLRPGTYVLSFENGLAFAVTSQSQGDVTLDSDINTNGETSAITITSGQVRTDIDAGYFSTAKGVISGQAFEDMNANGQNEAGDPVLAGIPVTLIADNGSTIGTTVTDAQGNYTFIGLLGGDYKITIGSTPNLNLTDANTGADNTDSDVNVANRESDLFSLATNTTVSNIDAGFFRYGSIGDFVWNDANEDGIQQPTETGINNVKVTINTTPTASTTTDASGKYTFDNLRPGTYVLTFENGLAFAVTSQSQGDVTLDSDINTNGETSAITIASGQVRTDVDAGYFSTAKGVISGQAFEDMNANGQNEAGDPVLAGIPVTLIADNGSTIGTTVTDAQGNYTFIGLLGGDYKITIGSTPNLNLTDANTGADNTDSDVNVVNRESALFSLATNTTVSDVDAGFFRYGSIGDFVWNDANEDGNQQSTELGLSNVKVTLLTSPSIVMTTGTSGSYSFSNLRPGSYKLSFEGPQPFVITKQNIGSVEAIDSDIDDDGFTTDIVIVSGQNNEEIDAGYFSTAKGIITGQAFEDMNANGQSEATDPVLSGIKVSLIDANSTVLATETTDATGRYTFTGFAAANYKIRIGDTPGFSITDANIGDDISDSDVESLTRESLPFFLQTNATLDNVDVGFYRGASIGDFVWFDANEDGIQQPNENGIPSVQVTINMVGQPNPNPISVLTDANGKYVFTNLKPANYTLQFATPANFTVTTVGQGTMDLDSDIDATGMTSSVPLTSGLIVTNVDAGYISTAKGSITGQAWEDTNADGQYQANETFLQGIPVTLVTSSGGLVATSTTDQNGNYAFNGLLSGDYKVLIGNTPDYLMTLDNVGDDLTDSDFDDILRETNVITVSTNATVSEIDAGFYKPASLGDFAWLDENEDGIQQAGEVGIANILVTINSTDPAAPFNSIMMTDGGGRYMFGGLRPGRYVVTFTTPTNFTITTQGQGTPSTDSDIDATGKSNEVTLVSGQSYLDIDAGYKSSVKGSIRGQVWEDLNANGQNDAGELGLVNVPVTLLTSNGTVVTSVNTDANGDYAFTALTVGDYKVVLGTTPGFLLTDANIGADATDSDMNTISRESDVITLATNAIINDIDAGLYGLGSVGDFVWNDINKNGIQDGGELGIAGVVVNIAGTGPNLGFIAQTTTNAAGAYTFTGLRPGLYGLKFDTPTGFIITTSVTGNDLVNSDINDLGLAGALINSRDSKTDIDAGYFETTVAAEGVINGLVWEDLNVNGQNEVGEPGLGEVSVKLLRTDGTTAATTITDSNGNYSFSGLAAGDYKVAIALVNGLVLTNANIGADATDSDFDVVTLESAVITLGASQTINDIDAGLYGNGSIGDFVWNDQNKNGLQDAGELGISGVIVNIVGLGTNASFVSQTVTNETGNYLFTNLRPGEYSLTFSTPFGFQVTPSIGNSNDTNSDIDAMGTVTVTINSRQNRTDIDAGFMQEAAAGTISGNIWEDKNGDGQRDADELPIVATSVTLFSVDGTGSVTLVGNSLTNEFGNYEFIGLTAGDYKLGLSGLEPYFVTFKNIGNDLSDSDFDDVTLETDVVTLAGSLTNIDAGLYQQGLIGDYVWFDANEDGIQQAGESGIANMVIVLSSINQTPAFLASTTTDATGRYLFSGIRPGNYNLAFENVSGDIPTIKNAGFDRTIDSDLNPNSSATVMLMSGAADFDVDAGFKASSASGIGGIVWIDKNGNGVRDAGELPLSGIGVNLLKIEANGSSTFVGTRTTDATGVYLFNNLASGDYKAVLFDFAPSSITLPNVGSDDIDSDFNPTTLESNVITYVSGTLINNVDGGLYQTASIGDFVWIDANKNGAQDAGEGGLAGVSMVLKNAQGTIVANQTTSSSGLYAFNGLVPGTYTVEATIPSIYRITLPNIGSNETNSDFQDANGIISSSVNLMSGMDMLNVDLGAFVNKSRILGVAWNDANGDGIRDLAETFIPGLDVSLLDGSGNTLTTTTVDANGKYEFNNLTSGSYRVKFGNIVGKYITLSNIGADDKDSDALGFTARTTDALIAANGLDIINVDAGYVNASMIGDFVWIDTDMDGLQGASEVGQNGMKVYLLDGNNTVIDSTFSNVNPSNGLNGYYIFDNLPYGTYRVRFTLPENFAYTTSNNSNPLLNSDILDLVTGLTNEITLTPGQSRLDIDAGYNILAATDGDISGVAWKDVNGDRLRDSNEPLLSGVSVTLKNNLNITIGTTVTDANGAYIFEDIAFGDYYILAPKQTPQLYVPYNGTPRPFDSDFVNGLGDGSTRLFTLFPGSDVNDIDLGYADRISVGDFAWEDLNVNGLVDGNEPGLADVTVVVKNIPGDVVGMAVTNASGQYLISDIPTGLYKLTFTAPSQFSPTFQDIAQPDINSDIDENGVTDLTNMTVPGPYRDVDAGYLRFGSIGDRVWLDLNGNGFLQPGEPGVRDIKIYLYTESGELRDSTTTDTTGKYLFDKVMPGQYYLEFKVPSTYLVSPAGVGPEDMDSDITETFGKNTTDLILVGSGASITNVDAAIYIPSVIGDFVWDDKDGDGIQDVGEPGVEGVSVFLIAQNGQLIGTDITDAQGKYEFGGLRQRLYFLQFSAPDGYIYTVQGQGPSGALDSDTDESGNTPLISLAHGVKFLEVDCGLIKSSLRRVTGNVWNDLDQDGLRDPSEPAMANTEIVLLDKDKIQLRTTKTNNAGFYSFVVVDQEMHYVNVKKPTEFVFTAKNVQNDTLINSDVNESGISDGLDMLVPIHRYVDAGMFKNTSASIFGKAWADLDGSQLRDAKDSLLSDVLVLLFKQDGQFVKSTKTDITGRYFFSNLQAGKYYIKVPVIDDMDYLLFTGNNQDVDSEITHQFGTGTSRLVTLVSGQQINNFDAGYTLTTRVFEHPESRNAVKVSIYPNPVARILHIQSEQEEIVDYMIFDASGKVLKKGQAMDQQIDIESMAPGMYYIRLWNAKMTKVIPFVKVDNY